MSCSQARNDSLKIFAHLARECTDSTTEHSAKIQIISGFLDDDLACQKAEYAHERTIILCESDSAARRTIIALHTKKYQTCILTSDLFSAPQFYVEQEKTKFITGHGRVAVCSVDVFEKADLPLVEHYIFFEVPSTKLGMFGNIIDIVEQKTVAAGRVTCIDIVTSILDSKDSLKALVMEMDSRRADVPDWLEDAFLNGTVPNAPAPVMTPAEPAKPPTVIVRPQVTRSYPPLTVRDAPTTTLQPAPVVPLPRKSFVMTFDPYALKPNAEGKYIVPASCVVNDADGEDDADDVEMYEEEEFNYDAYDNYEDEMEFN